MPSRDNAIVVPRIPGGHKTLPTETCGDIGNMFRLAPALEVPGSLRHDENDLVHWFFVEKVLEIGFSLLFRKCLFRCFGDLIHAAHLVRFPDRKQHVSTAAADRGSDRGSDGGAVAARRAGGS